MRVTLTMREPSGQTVHEVVFQQLRQGNTANVLDVFVILGIITSELLSLILQTQLVSCTTVGRQIGDQLRAVPVTQHAFHAGQQAFGVQNVLHEQLVNQDVNVIGNVVVDRCFEIPLEEVFEQCSHFCVEALLTVEIHLLQLACLGINHLADPLFADVIHREGNPLMLVPSERDSADACLVVLQVEAFDVDGQGAIHGQQLVQPCLDVSRCAGVLSKVDDAAARSAVVASDVADECIHALTNAARYLGRIVEDLPVVRHVDHFLSAELAVHHVAQVGVNLGSTSQHFEVVGVSTQDVLGLHLREQRSQHFVDVRLHLSHRGFLFPL